MSVVERLNKLKELMRGRQIDAYIIPSEDPHLSEYVDDHYKAREYITGFSGSAGIAVITQDKCGLWTDSRYFVQAEKQLVSTGITLYKMGRPGVISYEEFLKEEVHEFGKIGFDGQCMSFSAYKKLSEAMGSRMLISNLDYIGAIWDDRPKLPSHKATVFGMDFAGEGVELKLIRLREMMAQKQVDYTVIGSPEDICYLLNIRGTDVPHTPVVTAYALVNDERCYLCIAQDKLDLDIMNYLESRGIMIQSYEYLYNLLREITGKQTLYFDPNRINVSVVQSVNTNVRFLTGTNFTTTMKAIKNETEIAHSKNAYVKHGVALAKFFNWVETGVTTGVLTETLAGNKLQSFLKEGELYQELSFDTIAAYAENAAMPHYDATLSKSKTLEPKGLFLLDSGAQYGDGTTDITRTVALGPLTEMERTDYTHVLKSHIGLMTASFPNGTTGVQLDAIARYPLWKQGLDFGHGTGHGVGYVLSVHEGPQSISKSGTVPIVPGMVNSIEPGIYRENSHGIRIENIAVCVDHVYNNFGEFFKFECLSVFPIDTAPIVVELLTDEEIRWVNDYNTWCYDTLSSHLDGAPLDYLKNHCQPI